MREREHVEDLNVPEKDMQVEFQGKGWAIMTYLGVAQDADLRSGWFSECSN
jgi:hypothetical protein